VEIRAKVISVDYQTTSLINIGHTVVRCLLESICLQGGIHNTKHAHTPRHLYTVLHAGASIRGLCTVPACGQGKTKKSRSLRAAPLHLNELAPPASMQVACPQHGHAVVRAARCRRYSRESSTSPRPSEHSGVVVDDVFYKTPTLDWL
jgi:hypothetical protein